MDGDCLQIGKRSQAELKMKQLQALQKQQLRKQEMQMQLADQDMSSVVVQLVCRSIRIGSFRGQPSDCFKLTTQGVQFTVQCEGSRMPMLLSIAPSDCETVTHHCFIVH